MRRLARLLPAIVLATLLAPQPGAGASSDPASVAIRAALARRGPAAGERLLGLEALDSFYEGRAFRPAWVVSGAATRQARALLEALRRADGEGLNPEDYHASAIGRLLAPAQTVPSGTRDEADLGRAADLDLLFSDAFFLYAAHLTSGRVDPAATEPAWNVLPRARDLVSLLRAALEHDTIAETLRLLPPARTDYGTLKEALAASRAAAAAGGWPLVPWGKTLREGDRGPRIAELRRRLAATADLAAADPAGDLFDAPLAAALKRFQRRHGLDTDAAAGKRTLAALNIPAGLRARQIEANLERLRWLPRELGARYLMVNIADFRLELVEGGATSLQSRIIAGRQTRRTPFFSGEVTKVILNPPWTVPLKIATEDKLPLILEDLDYLANQHIRVFRIDGERRREIDPAEVDWMTLGPGRFPYRLRQDSGPWNALGRIKFQIPNRWDIYLHDTPAKELFDRSERIFSSGCIRVERALDLAERLLADNPKWSRAAIQAAIDAGPTVAVPLVEPLPVYLLYWTAWVDSDGTMQFRDDVYGRDEGLWAALRRPLGR